MAESAALLPRSGGTLSLAQWCHLFFFMVSGVATPLLVGFVKRQGACGVRTMFSVFPNYVVMIFTVCGNWRAPDLSGWGGVGNPVAARHPSHAKR